MMEVDFLPEHLVIIGGSYIALEFAQMYRRFGSEVTVIERGPRLLSREDEDVSETIRIDRSDLSSPAALTGWRIRSRMRCLIELGAVP